MEFPNINNKLVKLNTNKYLIDWKSAPSKGQQQIQDFLYKYWKYHIVLAELRIPSSLLRIDILNLTNKTIIEYSPNSHHNNYNPFFHKNRLNYFASIKRDDEKLEWAAANGYKFIEMNEKDLKFLNPQYFLEKFSIKL